MRLQENDDEFDLLDERRKIGLCTDDVCRKSATKKQVQKISTLNPEDASARCAAIASHGCDSCYV